MTDENKALSIQSLGDAVKEKVRKAMFDSIPDEAITQLIAKEFEIYFQDVQGDRYNSAVKPSPFKQLVKQEVESQFKERIKEVIRKKVGEVTVNWTNNGSEIVGSIVQEMAPYVQAGITRAIANDCVNILKNSLAGRY